MVLNKMALSNDAQYHKDALKEAMISGLVQTNAHFKHQQRGDPDLTEEEKSNIAVAILEKSPVLFLERFSKFLTLEDVQYFQKEREDYGVAFYLKEIEHRCKDTKHNVVKNRRYQALQELVEGGEYFSEEEMKWRDPLLFEQMVGQYCGESEKKEKDEGEIDRSDLRFSTILLKHMDLQTSKQYYGVLKEREEEQIEESDESSGEEGELEDDEEGVLTEVERDHMRGEFLRIMQERFLSGGDKDFDYSKVDSNTDYDSLDILGHDAEEKYFDDEMETQNFDQENLNDNPRVTSRHDPFEDVSQRLADVDLDNARQHSLSTPNRQNEMSDTALLSDGVS